MKRFKPNTEEEKAFNNVVKSMKKAKKLGLVFYGKASTLVSYTKDADNYNNEVEFQRTLGTGLKQVECLTADGVLTDSGADDYPCYRKYEDIID